MNNSLTRFERIRIVLVALLFINTPRTEQWTEAQAHYAEKSALKRSGKPEEIAAMVLGIINANHITGQVIAVDGGFLLG